MEHVKNRILKKVKRKVKPDSVEAKLRYLLREYPSFRDDDMRLYIGYLTFYEDLHKALGNKYNNYCEFFLRKGLPAFETIRRTRQKIQEKDESLAGIRRKKARAKKKAISKLKSLIDENKGEVSDDQLCQFMYDMQKRRK